MNKEEQVKKIKLILGKDLKSNKSTLDHKQKAQAILRWADESFEGKFDKSFAEKMAELEEDLTDKQKRAIDNIIDGYNINVEEFV